MPLRGSCRLSVAVSPKAGGGAATAALLATALHCTNLVRDSRAPGALLHAGALFLHKGALWQGLQSLHCQLPSIITATSFARTLTQCLYDALVLPKVKSCGLEAGLFVQLGTYQTRFGIPYLNFKSQGPCA